MAQPQLPPGFVLDEPAVSPAAPAAAPAAPMTGLPQGFNLDPFTEPAPGFQPTPVGTRAPMLGVSDMAAIYNAAGFPATTPAMRETDIAKQAGVGLGRAAIGMAGFPGLVGDVAEWAAGKAGVAPQTIQEARQFARGLPYLAPFAAPGPSTLTRQVESLTGPFRRAETPQGEVAERGFEFAGGLAGPGGIIRRVVGGVAAPFFGAEIGGRVGGEPGRLAGGLVGGGLGGVGRRAPVASTGAAEALRGAAKSGYATWDEAAANVIIGQPSFKATVDDIEKSMQKLKLDVSSHPETVPFFERLKTETSGPPPQFTMRGLTTAGPQTTTGPVHISLDGVEILRKQAADIANTARRPADRNAARVIEDKLEDFMNTLKPADMISAGPLSPTEMMTVKLGADKQWNQMRKTEILDGMWQRMSTNAQARFSQSGMENAIRSEFKSLANSFEPSATRSKSAADRAARPWTSEERQMIKHVAEGGRMDNALRWLGKFAPKGVVSTAAAAGVGGALGGIPGAIAAGAIGGLGHQAATSATLRNAERVYETVSGVKPNKPRGMSDLDYQQALTRAVLGLQGAYTGQLQSQLTPWPSGQPPIR